MIKAVILDVGNVVLELDWIRSVSLLQEKIGRNSQYIATLLEFLSESTELKRFEIGELSAEDFRSSVKSRLNIDIADSEFDDIWNACLPRKIPGINAAALELSRKFRLIGLSNTNEIHYEYFMSKFSDTFSHFESVYCSHVLGKAKPNQDIYKETLSRIGLDAQEVVFFDDRAENIEMATNLGFHAYKCFRSAEFILSKVNLLKD